MNNKQLAALYVELSAMYYEEYPDKDIDIVSHVSMMSDKIKTDSLSRQDIITLEPIFSYGHMDIHAHLKPKKRFIWF